MLVYDIKNDIKRSMGALAQEVRFLIKTPIEQHHGIVDQKSSYERGLNEYINKLIRQFYPKQMELNNIKTESKFRKNGLIKQ